jgi:hypothetical protein
MKPQGRLLFSTLLNPEQAVAFEIGLPYRR